WVQTLERRARAEIATEARALGLRPFGARTDPDRARSDPHDRAGLEQRALDAHAVHARAVGGVEIAEPQPAAPGIDLELGVAARDRAIVDPDVGARVFAQHERRARF